MNLKSKVAVVTGAASGIGREIARIFCRAGAKVAIAGLNQAGAAAAAAELGDADGAIGIGMDAGGRRYGSGCRCFWGIDMLVSDAGIHLGGGSTGRRRRNGHPSSREAMPVTPAACLR